MAELSAAALQTAGFRAFFRPRDVDSLGVSYRQLRRLVAAGVVQDLGGGLYRLAEIEPTELCTAPGFLDTRLRYAA